MKCTLSLIIQSLRSLWNCVKPISITLLAIALVVTGAFMPPALALSGHRHRMMMYDDSIDHDQCCQSSMEDSADSPESIVPDFRPSEQRRSPPRSMQRSMQRFADLETIAGTILDVRSPESQPLAPVTLMLQVVEDTTPTSDAATPDPIEILVAPQWYLTEQQIEFVPGDTITVTGLPKTLELKQSPLDTLQFFQAFTIQRPEGEIRLRSDRGFPRWQDSFSFSPRLNVYAVSSTSLYC